MKISIEANIGAGKTTVLARLCREKRIPVFLEPVDEWKDWLTLFYQDSTRWGLAFNLHVLHTFSRWRNNSYPAVYERSPVSNRGVFTELAHEQGRMNDLELELFDTMYKELAWEPDVIIYIRADPEICMERMTKRGRPCEAEVKLEYLKAIHDKHETLFNNGHTNVFSSFGKHPKRMIVIKVDGNQDAEQVYQDVVSALRAYI